MFVLQLNLAGEIVFAKHPKLATFLGLDNPNSHTLYQAWDPLKSGWWFYRHDHNLVPPLGTDFAILCHTHNTRVMSLRYFLTRFEHLLHNPAPVSPISHLLAPKSTHSAIVAAQA